MSLISKSAYVQHIYCVIIILDKKYVVYIQMQYPDPVKFDN